jgi:5-exo-hydroxycamphor dehydrogenase
MLQAYERAGGICVGDTVVIQGCGPVGLAAALLAGFSGASEVIVIGTPRHRLLYAQRIGATQTIDLAEYPTGAKRHQRLVELLPRKADIVVEAAGVVPAFEEGLGLIAKRGRYVVVGLWSAPGSVPVEPRALNNGNVRVIGSALFQPRHVYLAVQVANRLHRRLPLAEAVTHTFPLDRANQALAAVSQLETIKAVIQPA